MRSHAKRGPTSPGRATTFDPGVHMDAGAPLPHVLSNGRQTIVLFHAGLEPDPNRDGSTVTLIDPREQREHNLSWVRFDSVVASLFGPPNDEALQGHPLWGNGLQFYAFHRVENSEWIADLRARNRVHPNHQDNAWNSYQHFVITFHDQTLEVIAKSFEVGTRFVDFDTAIVDLARSLLD